LADSAQSLLFDQSNRSPRRFGTTGRGQQDTFRVPLMPFDPCQQPPVRAWPKRPDEGLADLFQRPAKAVQSLAAVRRRRLVESGDSSNPTTGTTGTAATTATDRPGSARSPARLVAAEASVLPAVTPGW